MKRTKKKVLGDDKKIKDITNHIFDNNLDRTQTELYLKTFRNDWYNNEI